MLDTFPNGGTYKSEKLGVDIRFKTYSDAKLASLLLDYDFPVHLFRQVLQLVQDPGFCLQDITFTDIWEIFEHVSDYRREVARERDSPARPRPVDAGPTTLATTASIVPQVALDLVVNRILEDDMPLGMLAKGRSWKSESMRLGADFRNMSLVHRSWTSAAQKALRRRVVVPYQQIDRFLLSPLCGPWVREMVIYWTVDNGPIGVTESDILLLDALLKHTPNVRSLSFNTFLVWPKNYHCPPFYVEKCLDILSARVPLLEDLRLKHFRAPSDNKSEFLQVCYDMFSLCTHISKFCSLQHLTIRSWTSPLQDERPLDWDKCPPCRLKSIELDLDDVLPEVGVRREALGWLLKPRNDYRLESLSIVDRLLDEANSYTSDALGESLEEILPEIVDLRMNFKGQRALNLFGTASSAWLRRLRNCIKVCNLELVVKNWCELDCFSPSSSDLPSSLRSLVIYCDESDVLELLSSRESLSKFSSNLEAVLPRLPLLRNILVTALPWYPHQLSISAAAFESLRQEFIGSFKQKHNIELSFI